MSRVHYGDLSQDGQYCVVAAGYEKDVPSLEERFRLADYGGLIAEMMFSGEPVIFTDISSHPRISAEAKAALAQRQIASIVVMPLIKEGRVKSLLAVHNSTPRKWTSREINMIEETAERTWMTVERARVEEALRESEQRFRMMINTVPQIIWITDPKGNVEFFNKRYYEYSGTEEGSKTAREIAESVVYPEDATKLMTAFEEARQAGSSLEIEQRNRSASGEYRWFLNRAEPYRDPKTGMITRWIGISVDIHDRKIAEQDLRDNQIRLDIAQRAARVAIWGYDLVDHHGIATPEFIALTGYPVEGETWDVGIFMNLVYPDDRQKLMDAHMNAAENHIGIVLEMRIMHPERGLLWVLMRGEYIPAYDLQNPTLMGSLIDITDLKEFEQRKDAFIGIASHELRTPVTSIKLYAEMLEEAFTESGDLQSAALMHKMDLQVDRLMDLIQSLLDTTTISETTLHLVKSNFSIDELIVETAANISLVAENHRIELTLAGTPPVFADKERIRQVLINLMSNAIKYSPSADKIVVKTSITDKEISVCVIDEGIGIPKELHARVFERFFRINNPGTATFAGLGLGLYISSGIVKSHGGTIRIESQQENGSVFCFTLPFTS